MSEPTDELRHHLRHVVEHAGHLLPPQGPITTFIHHNTLHGLQHLPFHEAIAEGSQVLGGRGYLPNEEYRALHAAGRITDEEIDAGLGAREGADVPLACAGERAITRRDVERAHLVHGVEALDPGQLRFELEERDAGRRFRGDVPQAARAAPLERAAAELTQSLERVGRDWTLADWIARHTELDVPARVRTEAQAAAPGADRSAGGRDAGHWLRKLGIPAERHEGYLDAVDRQLVGAEDQMAERDRRRARWLEAEWRLVRVLAPRHLGCRGSFTAIAAHFERDVEAYAILPLWHASLAGFGLDDPLSRSDPAQLVERDPESAGESSLAEHVPAGERRARMVAHARDALAEELDRLGRDRTHADLLSDLTGTDPGELVDAYMIRICAAFLDEGQAAWRMPERTLGFHEAWRGLASRDWTFAAAGVDGWHEALRDLPETPEDVIIEQLDALGIAPEQWEAYLLRLLARLPGWAGMIAWREGRPQYPRQQAQPIGLLDYLAVRLFCERLLVQALCDATWGIDGRVESLREHFGAQPSELFVRLELGRDRVPDHFQLEARALAERSGPGDADRWDALAESLWAHREREASGTAAVCHGAWRLFHLAQLLGLTATEVRSLDPAERDALIAAVDGLPAHEHGPLWLEAYERHYRDGILAALLANRGHGRWRTRETRPKAQVVFCIDEREEAIRRHFEELDPDYETFGTAGFFGVAMNYRGLDDHDLTPLCPPVVAPGHLAEEVARPGAEQRLETHRTRANWDEVAHGGYWEVKRNALSAYFLVDLMGPLQTVPLVGRVLTPWLAGRVSTRLERRLVPPVPTQLAINADDGQKVPDGGLQAGFTTAEQADRVEATLRNVGLTDVFARFVVLTGHGSVSVNNPHESAHDCGACGGKHGGPNGRAFAAMANRPQVRALLRERGIEIPDDTWFVGSQHNTASELYSYFDTDDIPASYAEEFDRLVAALDEARRRSAQERCRRFASAPKDASLERSLRHIETRSSDLSQVRPEWGHATNAFAVVGRRAITQGLFLDRRPFLISYDPSQDPEGTILERILLAVGPVGAGINLEYYFSTVDNRRYGSDTKVPHNVSGLIGVMEGAASDLRTGLPKQMVEVHEPMRLQLAVEAKLEVLGAIYGRQESLQELLGNAWVHLIAIDPDTGELNVFLPHGEFQAWDGPLAPLPTVGSSFEWYRGERDFLPPARIVQTAAGEPAGASAA